MVTFNSGGAGEAVLPGKGFVVERKNYELLLQKTIEGAAMKKDFGCPEIKDKGSLGGEYEEIFKTLLNRREK